MWFTFSLDHMLPLIKHIQEIWDFHITSVLVAFSRHFAWFSVWGVGEIRRVLIFLLEVWWDTVGMCAGALPLPLNVLLFFSSPSSPVMTFHLHTGIFFPFLPFPVPWWAEALRVFGLKRVSFSRVKIFLYL